MSQDTSKPLPLTDTEPQKQIDHWTTSLFQLKNGDIDYALNKTIFEIILVTEKFIVYLDNDYSIQWRIIGGYIEPPGLSFILGIVALLEGRSRFIEDTTILAGVRKQIAESLARCMDGIATEESMKLLREADIEIGTRNKETSWKWYFGTAAFLVFIFTLAIITLWLVRADARILLGNIGFEVVIGSLCGPIGAILSIATRGDRLHLDANAGKWIHRMEAISRIGAGLAGAAFVAAAIKSGLLLGGVSFQGSTLALLLTFCMAAGMSERLIPNLISKIDKTIDGNEVSKKSKGDLATNETPYSH